MSLEICTTCHTPLHYGGCPKCQSSPAPQPEPTTFPNCDHISDDLISRRAVYRLIERMAGMTVQQIDHDCMGEPFVRPDPKPAEIYAHVLKGIEECGKAEQPSPPAGAEQLADKWKAEVKHYDCECSTAHLAEFAEAYAKKERERADAAERERNNVTTQWSIAADEVESLRTELREAKQRLQTFEDEHKRFLILSQTVVDLERGLREMREALDYAKELISEIMESHLVENDCVNYPCAWCMCAKGLLSRKGEGS